MAFLIYLKIIYFVYILSGCLYCFGQGHDIDIKVFENLGEINKKWLQLTSIPEVARLLYYPPYSYHSRDYIYSAVNASKLNKENRTPSTFSAVLNENDDKCSDDLLQVIWNIDSMWALQMLDSDGKLTSGILKGGLLWPGHYSECIDVYAPLDEKGHGNFHGQYCVSSWTLSLSGKFSSIPLTVGLCVPDSCSGDDLKTTLKNVSHILDRVPFLKTLESYLTLNSIVCKDEHKSLDAPAIVYLCIVSVFIILTVVGSLLVVFDSWKLNYITRQNLLSTVHGQGYGSLNIQRDVESDLSETTSKEPSDNTTAVTPNFQTSNTPQSVPVWKRLLLCFSIFSNGQKILSVGKVEGQLLSIHGIRFLSLTWVILGHTYIMSVSIIGNKLDVLKDIDSFMFQMLLQSPFSVDSFFLLSGFLLTYLFLKEATKKEGKINWVHFYLHRLWRLTPPYLTIVFFYMLIFKYMGSGPFWDDDHCVADRSSWWKYLLYINNFIPIRKMCVGWSWYLANDMQFYIISPLFLYPLWKWPTAGFTIIASLLLGTWITTGAMSYSYDLIPMFVGATQAENFTAYEDKMWDSFDLIYDKPYCRIAPYLIGVILGYVLHKTANRKDFLTWWQQLLGWSIALFCSLSVVFGLYHVEMSRTVSLFYNALCRSSFSIGLAWLIYACETGHGGFIAKFLSWELFIPLSRLTYSAYLVHPAFIHGYYQAYQTAFEFTEIVVVSNFLGFLIISFGLAFIFSLVFESPFMNLEKLMLKKKAQ